MKRVLTALVMLAGALGPGYALSPEAFGQTGAEVHVFQRGGNIYASSLGRTLRITSSGLDSDPYLSRDGRLVAFVRRTPSLIIDTGIGGTDLNELWMADISGNAIARRLLTGHPGGFEVDDKLVLAGFSSPRFSDDNKTVYFLAQTWATAGALWKIDVATSKPDLIVAGAIQFGLVHGGKHNGRLIVQRRSGCRDSGGLAYACDPYFLFTSEGKQVAQIGADGADLRALLAEHSKP
jgi:hypothetical protein